MKVYTKVCKQQRAGQGGHKDAEGRAPNVRAQAGESFAGKGAGGAPACACAEEAGVCAQACISMRHAGA